MRSQSRAVRKRRGQIRHVILPVVFLAGILLTAPLSATADAATPAISAVTVTAIGPDRATISWTTDIPADTQIDYGLTSSYGSTTPLVATLTTSHSQTVTGLAANQLYHFRVRSRDGTGTLSTSGNSTLATLLGVATPGTLTDSSNANGMNASQFTTVRGGTLRSVAVHVGVVDANVANRQFQVAVYTSTATNTPGTLVANSASGTLAANTWNSVPISATLAANTPYFFVYNTNGASASVNNLHYTSTGRSGWRTAGQPFGSWPSSFGAFSTQTATFSFQASFVGDAQPPSVAITDPANGSTVSGAVTVTASATDDQSVASVQILRGGQPVGPPDTLAPYTTTVDTTSLQNGPLTFTAVATDTSGNTATSSPITVTASNPPRVILTGPTPGQAISGTSVTATYIEAGDWLPGDGHHVHFRLDGGPVVMDLDPDNDQSFTFGAVPNGAHVLAAVVADANHVELPGTGGEVAFTTVSPDVTAPTVSITAPAAGATVANTVTVSADATDDRTVVGVQFLLDGTAVGGEDTVAPYTLSWDTTTAANGAHVLTARARDSVNQTVSAPVSVTVQNTDPRATVGEWGPVIDWPMVAVHATLLRTGEILMWDAWELPTSQARLWNPSTGVFTDVFVQGGLFCSGQATNAAGELVVAGGHAGGEIGIRNVNIFDPVSRTWRTGTPMAAARWYPSVTQMADNRLLVLSGQITSGTFADTAEVYNSTANTIATLPFTTPQLREIQYPQTALLPSGKVMSISAEHGSIMAYDPANSSWTNIGTTQVPYGAWTSLSPGRFLITGGGATFNSYNPSNPGPSQRTARLLDMTSGSPVWTPLPDMPNGRSFHNVTMLPTGQALAVGGATVVNDYATTGTLTADLFDPTTNTWRPMANPARPRMYHSVSILLPDGRVLSAGGGRLAPAPDQPNAQIYSPPYLFKGPRPTITSAPASVAYGETMAFESPQAASIAKVSLVNLASVTHTADWNQHFVDLPFTRNGTTLTISAPANANLAPENWYMVFLVDSNGVPSESKIVKLGGGPDTTAPVLAAVQATNVGTTGATVSWTTDEPADTWVEYGTTVAYGSSTTRDPALATAHSQNLTGLTPGTLYHYRVTSRDGAGNVSVSTDRVFTTVTTDTQAPTVGLTAPTAGATLTGIATLTATASDNVGVIGVQFLADGVAIGLEDTAAPFSLPWTTSSVADGSHVITAVARDASGNSATSAPVTVTITNTVAGGGLVAAYNFNEGSGATVTDRSGNGNTGTIFQAAWNTTGRTGGSLTFDGSNDYVSIADAASLDLTTGMTVEAWVYQTRTSGWNTVLLKENGGDLAYGIYSREATNRPSAWIRGTGQATSTTAPGTTALTRNAWRHLAATFDGTTLRFYVDGVQVGSQPFSGSVAVSSGPLKLGGNAIWGEFFGGRLDDVRVYNRALTAPQIQADMATPVT